MLAGLTNHLWQSTLFAAAAGLLTLAFRKNRAKVRYWLWFSASCKFFVPFTLLMSLGSHVDWAPAARTIAAPVSLTIVEIGQPFSDTLPFVPPTERTADWLPIAIFSMWACGFAGVALVRLRGWLRVRAAVRASTRIDLPAAVEVRASPGLLEPGVVGFWRPILLLPAGIAERLTPPQLEAVLAHELSHVRRRDNLFAATHMIVEAMFWFHPLVWWIGARLVEERERACDEEVLSLGNAPHVYAEGILNVCKLYMESPLVCVSGVTGSDLKRRIEAIMANHLALRLNFTRKAALVAAGVAALASPVVVGIMNAPFSKAQSAAPKFEVASVKFSKDCGVPAATPDSKGVTRKGGGPGGVSPGRLHTCATVEGLIQGAYFVYADGHSNRTIELRTSGLPISGGPAWVHSDRYMIDAKPEGAPGQEMMNGPMMQALLEDRFHLQIHHENREVPVYDLTVAKGGPKLQPFQEGSCIPADLTKAPQPRPPEGQKNCGASFGMPRGQVFPFVGQGLSLDRFAKLIGWAVDRPVVDKTGITGLFDFHLDFATDENTSKLQPLPGGDTGPAAIASEPAGPNIFTAIQQQLGLKLEPGKGSREFLVIDHVERPTGN